MYNEPNSVWKSQILNQKWKFRHHMSCLAKKKKADKIEKVENFKKYFYYYFVALTNKSINECLGIEYIYI